MDDAAAADGLAATGRSAVRLAALAALLLGAALALAPGRASAQAEFPSYVEESDLLATTPSTDDGPIGAMWNPAQWGVPERPEMIFFWADGGVRRHALDNWGFAGGSKLGYSVRRRDFRTAAGPRRVTDYQIGAGGGDGGIYHGFAFGFSGAGKSLAGRENYLALGQITRPRSWISTGLSTRYALGDDAIDGIADVGIRPRSDPRLLLFADYSLRRRQRWDDGALGGGFAVRPMPGIEAAAKWNRDDRFQVAVGVTLGRGGFRAVPRLQGGEAGATHYVARVNPPVQGFDLDARVNRGRRFLEMTWKGSAVYQGYRILDRGSLPLRRTIEEIQFAIDDPTVGGLAINLSGHEANLSMAWELREKLLEMKRGGKKLVVYCDRLSLSDYYLAAAADHIIMDPQGWLIAPGVQASRTYLKGTLEKLGIGFEEWRHFKYKSVNESLSRTDMSEADREQTQEAVDAVYGELASGIAASGRMTRERLDATVNDEPILTAARLLELKWIEEVGRWEDVEPATARVAGRSVVLTSRRAIARMRFQPDETWGAPPVIALVYAVGDCAMDSGIRGRETSKALREFRKNPDVKAVVLRADSPGGDPLPSDLVAGETKAFAQSHKPILVSQGRVAASGGYWISMEADSISTSPFTITGSIGVAAGWYWNAGLGAKLGLTSDHVKAGRSADLLGGLQIPFLGAQIPERNLDERERALTKRLLFDIYDDFVKRVAKARGLEESYVREIGEGRIYMGRAALGKKLVDRVATLDQTIAAARLAAGIPPERKIRVVEYPKAPLIRLPGWLGGVATGGRAGRSAGLGSELGSLAPPPRSYEAAALQQMLNNPGLPLLLVPPSLLPGEPEATLTGGTPAGP